MASAGTVCPSFERFLERAAWAGRAVSVAHPFDSITQQLLARCSCSYAIGSIVGALKDVRQQLCIEFIGQATVEYLKPRG
ncbi:hypothetical protein Dimus_023064 [Dionaea muscipula]